jgi:transcriptional regulator with XRE-family HTH domain
MISFAEWLNKKFEDWSEREGGDKAAFAKWLGIPSTTLSNWLNGGYKPRGENLGKLSNKFGVEVYEILGLSRIPSDEQLRPIAELILSLPEAKRPTARKKIIELLQEMARENSQV